MATDLPWLRKSKLRCSQARYSMHGKMKVAWRDHLEEAGHRSLDSCRSNTPLAHLVMTLLMVRLSMNGKTGPPTGSTVGGLGGTGRHLVPSATGSRIDTTFYGVQSAIQTWCLRQHTRSLVSLRPLPKLNMENMETMNMDRRHQEPTKGQGPHIKEEKVKMVAKTSRMEKVARRGLHLEEITRARAKETDPEIDHSQGARAHLETAGIDPPQTEDG